MRARPRPKQTVRVENLVKEFEVRGAKGEEKILRAVNDVTFGVRTGTTMAIVGESGSGKSTVANIILNLLDPTSGKVFLRGHDLATRAGRNGSTRGARCRWSSKTLRLAGPDVFSVQNCRRTPASSRGWQQEGTPGKGR